MSESSPLLELERNCGGRLQTDQSGRLAVADFGNPRAEYQAAQTEAALFDLGDRSQVEVTGRDGQKFLHNFCTNEIRGLQPGQGCEAFVTNIQGKVLGHIFVFVTPHSIWIDSVPGSGQKLISHLSKYAITEDVEFHSWAGEWAGAAGDSTGEWGELFVSGPESAARLAGLSGDLGELRPYGHGAGGVANYPLFTRRVDLLGQPGYYLVCRREGLVRLWQQLANLGFRPSGFEAFHGLRIEARMPLYGLDINEDNLAQEVGRTSQAISFTKGCYLGQEPIARIHALGHVNQELRGLRLSRDGGTGEDPPVLIPAPGTPVLARGETKEIGRVTSSGFSYAGDCVVALAYLRRNYLAAGSEVTVKIGDREFAATVFE